jgi:lysozyme
MFTRLTVFITSLLVLQANAYEFVTNISDQGLETIKQFEAYVPNPYYDHKAYSIGYGTQRLCNGKKVTSKTKAISEKEATKHLQCVIDVKNDLLLAYYYDNKMEISQDIHDALLSFTYNLGSYMALKSNVFKHLINKNCIAAKKSLLSYNKASGQVLKGLVLRRQKEAESLINGCKLINETLGYDYYKVTETKKKPKKTKVILTNNDK